jgi:hypothetical protein
MAGTDTRSRARDGGLAYPEVPGIGLLVQMGEPQRMACLFDLRWWGFIAQGLERIQ